MLKFVVTIFFLGASGVLFVTFFAPLPEQIPKGQVIISDCKLNIERCDVSFTKKLTVGFHLEPQAPPPLTPLSLQIVNSLAQISHYKVWFEGRDMEMGKHYLLPKNTPASVAEDDVITFSGMIPVCSLGEAMVWELNVEFLHQGVVRQVIFNVQPALSQ